MKRAIFLFAFLFTVSSSFISCRETTNEENEVEVTNDDLDDVGNEIEDAVDDTGDAIEDGANEIDNEIDNDVDDDF